MRLSALPPALPGQQPRESGQHRPVPRVSLIPAGSPCGSETAATPAPTQPLGGCPHGRPPPLQDGPCPPAREPEPCTLVDPGRRPCGSGQPCWVRPASSLTCVRRSAPRLRPRVDARDIRAPVAGSERPQLGSGSRLPPALSGVFGLGRGSGRRQPATLLWGPSCFTPWCVCLCPSGAWWTEKSKRRGKVSAPGNPILRLSRASGVRLSSGTLGKLVLSAAASKRTRLALGGMQ